MTLNLTEASQLRCLCTEFLSIVAARTIETKVQVVGKMEIMFPRVFSGSTDRQFYSPSL